MNRLKYLLGLCLLTLCVALVFFARAQSVTAVGNGSALCAPTYNCVSISLTPPSSPQPGTAALDGAIGLKRNATFTTTLPSPNTTCCGVFPVGYNWLYSNIGSFSYSPTFFETTNNGDWKTNQLVLLGLWQNNYAEVNAPIQFRLGGTGQGGYLQSIFQGTSLNLVDASEIGGAPAPTCSPVASMAAQSGFLNFSVLNANGESVVQNQQTFSCGINTVVVQPAPQPGSGAAEWNVYASVAGGASNVLQNATPMPLSTPWVEPTSGLATGTATPPPCDHTGGAFSYQTGIGNTIWSFQEPINSASPCPGGIIVSHNGTDHVTNIQFNDGLGPTFTGLASATAFSLCGGNASPIVQCAQGQGTCTITVATCTFTVTVPTTSNHCVVSALLSSTATSGGILSESGVTTTIQMTGTAGSAKGNYSC